MEDFQIKNQWRCYIIMIQDIFDYKQKNIYTIVSYSSFPFLSPALIKIESDLLLNDLG